MKTKKLTVSLFSKLSITELNDQELLSINGGAGDGFINLSLLFRTTTIQTNQIN
ncbi:hypothetical protein [Lacinutrix sp. Hel_I_90]|uniref:hypothetical protein n=1 Tax=Lacinutrix sp. Hel_I_90 TaxID=1249999 RepID=UPI000A8645DD|nr:hypothetical protein [Lacinutrix sp. Hel_I_90]